MRLQLFQKYYFHKIKLWLTRKLNDLRAEGVGQGTDFTLYAEVEGTVKFFEKKRTRFDGRVYKDTYVSVV